MDKILCAQKETIVNILEYLKVDNIAEIKRQYSNIHLVKWQHISDTNKFWGEVFNYKDSGGNHRFLELATVALQLLSLPWSNAEIERVFSKLNLIKNKLRNALCLTNVNKILCIR